MQIELEEEKGKQFVSLSILCRLKVMVEGGYLLVNEDIFIKETFKQFFEHLKCKQTNGCIFNLM
jgi:hypothetical protein